MNPDPNRRTHPARDGREFVPRASRDRRGTPDRRTDERRKDDAPSERERRSGAERRNFLRRILGERRGEWPPPEPAPETPGN